MSRKVESGSFNTPVMAGTVDTVTTEIPLTNIIEGYLKKWTPIATRLLAEREDPTKPRVFYIPSTLDNSEQPKAQNEMSGYKLVLNTSREFHEEVASKLISFIFTKPQDPQLRKQAGTILDPEGSELEDTSITLQQSVPIWDSTDQEETFTLMGKKIKGREVSNFYTSFTIGRDNTIPEEHRKDLIYYMGIIDKAIGCIPLEASAVNPPKELT